MMAAASPRWRVKETPERMESGPRGVGYVLASWVTESMGMPHGTASARYDYCRMAVLGRS